MIGENVGFETVKDELDHLTLLPMNTRETENLYFIHKMYQADLSFRYFLQAMLNLFNVVAVRGNLCDLLKDLVSLSSKYGL
jgi:hypothetical protein